MKSTIPSRSLRVFLPLLLCLTLVLTSLGSTSASGIPVLTIKSVEVYKNVTVHGENFPAGQTFTVKMGPYGTYALGGTKVGTIKIDSDGAFNRTFDIPDALANEAQVAIRMDSEQGYYSYNWFYNNPNAVKPTPPIPGYNGFPTFTITSVEEDESVSLVTYNLPPDQTFTIRMGAYGTYALDGVYVGTLDSGKGGTLTPTFKIPDKLKGLSTIAIRMDCPAGLYAYNWFYNNTAAVTIPPAPGYTGIPTFGINAVVKGKTVTIAGKDFPAGQTFTVTMGEYGTYGISGIKVGTYESGTGGSFTKTFDVTSSLAGNSRIAIRLETDSGYFYAFNWFYNNTTN